MRGLVLQNKWECILNHTYHNNNDCIFTIILTHTLLVFSGDVRSDNVFVTTSHRTNAGSIIQGYKITNVPLGVPFVSKLNFLVIYKMMSVFVTVYEKTRHMGLFMKVEFGVWLISSIMELTRIQDSD